jgi:hypothetical protein
MGVVLFDIAEEEEAHAEKLCEREEARVDVLSNNLCAAARRISFLWRKLETF